MSSKAEKFYQQHLKKKGIHARMSRNAQARDPNSLRNRLALSCGDPKLRCLRKLKGEPDAMMSRL